MMTKRNIVVRMRGKRMSQKTLFRRFGSRAVHINNLLSSVVTYVTTGDEIDERFVMIDGINCRIK